LRDLFQKAKAWVSAYRKDSDTVVQAMVARNLKTFSVVSLIIIPILLIQSIMFWNTTPANPIEQTWHTAILVTYTCLAAVLIFLRAIIFFVRKREKKYFLLLAVQWTGVAVFLASGIALVTIDQMITTNITPFFLMCIAVAIFFLMRPVYSIPLFSIVLLGFYWAIGLTQPNPAVLLSNRINGVAAVSTAIILSVILWRNAVVNILQEYQLAAQQEELEDKNRLLERYAYYDHLTGLCNRRLFRAFFDKEIPFLKRTEKPACLMLIDVDFFKNINDIYGHPMGDRVLTQLAKLLESKLRESDIISRWGGEEFLCLLRETSQKEGLETAERLREAVARESFGDETHPIAIAVSIGIALIDGSADDCFEVGYRFADSALYEAKRDGRNRTVVYEL